MGFSTFFMSHWVKMTQPFGCGTICHSKWVFFTFFISHQVKLTQSFSYVYISSQMGLLLTIWTLFGLICHGWCTKTVWYVNLQESMRVIVGHPLSSSSLGFHATYYYYLLVYHTIFTFYMLIYYDIYAFKDCISTGWTVTYIALLGVSP